MYFITFYQVPPSLSHLPTARNHLDHETLIKGRKARFNASTTHIQGNNTTQLLGHNLQTDTLREAVIKKNQNVNFFQIGLDP